MTFDLRAALSELRTARLPAATWAELTPVLVQAAGELEAGSITDSTAAAIDRARFEGEVRGRLSGGAGPAPAVAPTKPTSGLIWVGLVCGLGITAVGFALGGGGVAAATALFGVFVFAVALSGSRLVVGRRRRDSSGRLTGPAPAPVVDLIDRLLSRL